jgi:hypothetical protein
VGPASVPDISYTNGMRLDRQRGEKSSRMSITVPSIRIGGEAGTSRPFAPRSDLMTTTLTATPSATTRPTVWRTGLAAGVAAAVATTAVAVTARAIDVPLEIDGKVIPLAAFAQLTLLFTGVGVLLARLIRRRSAFRTTAIVLTALSLVPDLAASASTATKLTLMVTHLVTAAIVIPMLTARLPEHR